MYKVEDLYVPEYVQGVREWLALKRKAVRTGVKSLGITNTGREIFTPLGLAVFGMAGVDTSGRRIKISIELELQLLAAEPEELV